MPRADGHLTNKEMSDAISRIVSEQKRRLLEIQEAAEHAIRTGEIKRTPQNSTPAKHLDDE